ncbi:MAG TPA: non-canonical purine NTP pyrophosphatase, partial [Patescibacteria group bacterium]
YHSKTKSVFFEEEKIKGHIAEKPSGKPTKGYPFRAIFIVDKFNKYYDELTDKEHRQVNHRLIALKRLTKRIKDLIL